MQRLTIGDFARLTHLSVKMLRRYHESGLLEPVEVDARTGYRYYAPDQIPVAQTIHRFRELGMPVREIGDLLATGDPHRRDQLIAGHLQRLEDQLERTRAAVASLRRLLAPRHELEVVRHHRPATVVAAVVGTVGRDDVLDWYSAAVRELDAVLADHGQVPTGPAGGQYDNELFTDDEGVLVVHRPAGRPPTSGRVAPFTIPAAELVSTVHHGPHDDIDITYGELGRWIVDHDLAVDGPVHETYLVGPHDSPDPATWRTELGWPVVSA